MPPRRTPIAPLADADRVAFDIEATGKQLIHDAINVLSSEQVGIQVKLALIHACKTNAG